MDWVVKIHTQHLNPYLISTVAFPIQVVEESFIMRSAQEMTTLSSTQ